MTVRSRPSSGVNVLFTEMMKTWKAVRFDRLFRRDQDGLMVGKLTYREEIHRAEMAQGGILPSVW